MMRSVDLGSEYEQLGRLLIDSIEENSDASFLYAEIQPNVVAASLFFDVADHIIYRNPSDKIFDFLLELWDSIDENERWHCMKYYISGGKFHVKFEFSENMDAKELQSDRRERVVREVFGNRLVDYSNP